MDVVLLGFLALRLHEVSDDFADKISKPTRAVCRYDIYHTGHFVRSGFPGCLHAGENGAGAVDEIGVIGVA